jgi:hypothetical protein
MKNIRLIQIALMVLSSSCVFAQQVGIVFQTWNRDWRWGVNGSNSVTEPVFGYYDSQDVEVIKKQGMMLRDANVDFVVTDWTNNIDYHPSLGMVNHDIGHIEESTVLVAETWAKIPGAPKITIVLGSAYGITMDGWHVPDGDWNTDGTPGPRLRMKFDQIHRTFIENPALKEQFYHVDGKPFIILWGNPMDRDIRDPNNIPFDFEWRDDRFTMRHMIGLASSKPWIINDHQGEFVTVHKGVWTWAEQSGRRGLAYLDGKLDCMAVNPTALRNGSQSDDNNNGATFSRFWDQAIEKKPAFVFVKAYNEFMVGENPNFPAQHFIVEPFKNDPSSDRYLKILREKAATYKGIPTGTYWDFPDVPVEDWHTKGLEPYYYSPQNLQIPSASYQYVVVRIKNPTASTNLELFWITNTDSTWNTSKSTSIAIAANDTLAQAYVFQLAGQSSWNQTIKQLRLSLAPETSGSVEYEWIKIVGPNDRQLLPYISVNSQPWDGSGVATLDAGGQVWIRPQPAEVPGWNWIGPNGFRYSGPDFYLNDIQPSQSGVYTGIYIDSTGKSATTQYTVTVRENPTTLRQIPIAKRLEKSAFLYNLLGQRYPNEK